MIDCRFGQLFDFPWRYDMNEDPITTGMENSEAKCSSSWQFEFKCGEEK